MKKVLIIIAAISLGLILTSTIQFDWLGIFSCKNCCHNSKSISSLPDQKQPETQVLKAGAATITEIQSNNNEQTKTQKDSAVVHITKENIEKEVHQSNIPVVLDVYSTVCPPCAKLSPIIEELAHEYQNKYKFCKLNIDKHFMTANEYKVRTLPTLIFIKNNETKGRSGFLKKDEIIERLSTYFEQ